MFTLDHDRSQVSQCECLAGLTHLGQIPLIMRWILPQVRLLTLRGPRSTDLDHYVTCSTGTINCSCDFWPHNITAWLCKTYYTTRYTHVHHVPHAEHVEQSDETVKHGLDDVEDFEDVSGTPCCPPPVLFTAQRVKLIINGQNYL